MPDPIVTTYVDAAVAQLRRVDLMRWPGKLPEAMVDGSIRPMDDWVGWKPVPSTATDRDLDALEAELGAAYPPPYRDLLTYVHFVELTERGVGFIRHLPGEWTEALRKAYFAGWAPERIVRRGLVPFGRECFMDAGPVCFDTRARATDGDCPVVFWDHEWIDSDREVCPLFSSSRKMLECLTLVAQSDCDFLWWDEDAPPADLEARRELLARFLSIDPDGAGGVARSYWTSWAGPAGA